MKISWLYVGFMSKTKLAHIWKYEQQNFSGDQPSPSDILVPSAFVPQDGGASSSHADSTQHTAGENEQLGDFRWFMSVHFKSRGAFSALMLLVWCQEGHPAWKNWVVRCWHGYLSGARCKWSAYGPADVTATPSSLASLKSRIVYLFVAGLPRLTWKEAFKPM